LVLVLTFGMILGVGLLPLLMFFLICFAKTKKPDVCLATIWNDGFSKLFLRQDLTNIARKDNIQIMEILNNLHLSPIADSATWLKDPSEIYSIKSAYEFLNFRGIKLK
jgi:hypothetical protein